MGTEATGSVCCLEPVLRMKSLDNLILCHAPGFISLDTSVLFVQEKKKAVPKVTPMAFGRRMGEDTSPRSVYNVAQRGLLLTEHVVF